jgi:hypothetical protein
MIQSGESLQFALRVQLRRRLPVVATMAIAYVPAFVLPFALAAVVPDRRNSDAVLLAVSTAVTAGSVLGLAFENAWAAFASNVHSAGAPIADDDFIAGIRQSATLGFVLTAVLLPIFAGSYLFGDVKRGLLFVCLASVFAFPVFGGLASVSCGILNANGRIPTNLALQGVRGMFPLAGILLVSDGDPVWIVGALLSLGELVRASLAAIMVRRYIGNRQVSEFTRPSTSAVLHHIGGLAVLGASPIIDRSFYAAANVGAVTRFEMADRVFFAGNQICNNLLVLPRIGVVGRSLLTSGVTRVAKAEIRRVVLISGALSAIGTSMLLLALPLLPGSMTGFVPWAIALLVSLPAAVGGTVATRLLVAAGHSRVIPYMALVGVTSNFVLNVLGTVLFGAFGVVLSTVVVRYLLLLLTRQRLISAEAKKAKQLAADELDDPRRDDATEKAVWL